MREFNAKYRGQVVNNVDPRKLGRLQVQVPAVLGAGRLSWAMPCVPYAGMQVGLFALPAIGANVWVEFEGGDPDYPIWSGCFWGSGELPAQATSPDVKLFKTETVSVAMSAAGIELTSTGGQIQLRNGVSTVVVAPDKVQVTQGAATVKVSADGIEIVANPTLGSIKVLPSGVNVNNGALEVT